MPTPASNNSFSSYQHQGAASSGAAGAGTYQPPSASNITTPYAQSQTQVLTDAARTQFQAEDTANVVLTRLTEQRHQLTGAHENVHGMRTATEKARQELETLHHKYREKKFRLYIMIGALGLANFLVFVRIAWCRGGFFC